MQEMYSLYVSVEKLRGLGAEISKVDRMPAALESAM